MKYVRLSSLLFLLACYQDLSKLKETNSSSAAGTTATGNSVVVLNKTSTTIAFGATDQLTATVLPNPQSITWTSLDTNIATVSASGLVTATGSGSTQVIGQIQGGVAYAACAVTVPLGFSANPADGSTVDTLSTLTITYSTAMNAQAWVSTNYTLSGAGKGTLSTNPFAVTKSGNAYSLSFSGAPGNGNLVLTLTGANIKTTTGMTLPNSILNYATYNWYTFLGGAGIEYANAIQQTSDGGYIIAGQASANIANMGGQTPLNAYSASDDFLVIKLTAAGAVSWYSFFGGAGGDVAHSIQQTSDGGYIVAGYAGANIANLGGQMPLNAYSASQDEIIVKLTAAGAVSWYTFLGGGGNDVAKSIQQTSDGGYIVAGHATANIANLGGQTPLNAYSANSDFLVIKQTAAGAVSWYTFLGGTGLENADSIQQTSDGGYIVVGVAGANIASMGGQVPLNAYSANYDFLAIKLTAGGAVSWYSFLGGGGNDLAKSIQQTSDGGYIVAGYAGLNIASLGGQAPLNAHAGNTDGLVIKLTADGSVQWYTFLGGAGFDVAWAIQQTSDSGYVVAGNSNADIANMGGQVPLNAYSANYDFLAIKLTAAGSLQWYTFLGGTANDEARAIQQTSDGGYVVAGFAGANIASLGGQTPLNAYSASGDALVIRLKSNGRL